MEVGGDPQGLIDGDGVGEVDIEGAGNTVDGDGGMEGVGILFGNRGAEHIGVDAAIGTGTARDITGVAEELFGAFVEGLLDGATVFLGLVAAEAGAVVADIEEELLGHGAAPFVEDKDRDSIAQFV